MLEYTIVYKAEIAEERLHAENSQITFDDLKGGFFA